MNRKSNIFIFFLFLLAFSLKGRGNDDQVFRSYEVAQTHPIIKNKPVFDFFEGVLLGNGRLGVVATTRPDGVVLYLGHNDVWDIRLAENNREKIGTFQEVFEKVKRIPDTLAMLTQDSWYNAYNRMTGENYAHSYPRPFPCGSVLIGFDRREVELTGHRLDVANGLCEVYFLKNGEKLKLQLFVDMQHDRVWMRLMNEKNQLAENIFSRVRLIPDPSTPAEFPHYQVCEDLSTGKLAFRQILPHQLNTLVTGNDKDEAFKTTVTINGSLEKANRLNWNGNLEKMGELEASLKPAGHFLGCITLEHGSHKQVASVSSETVSPGDDLMQKSWEANVDSWKQFWEKSGVKLADNFLEQIWYQNLYFFNCAVKEGGRTPGIFANWNYNQIGTSWHGDYHMNYNTQQPFWLTFSSNHLEKNLSYVELIEQMMPVSEKWAKEYYGLPGAYFPHSAFPVEMNLNPYPVPDWGWEICETPWAVQGLWWHYLYSGDIEFLKGRAYVPIKKTVQFLVAYMSRPEARNKDQWNDDRFHIFPTVPPELYGLRPGFRYNYDCSMDLALTRFIFKAFQQATQLLGTEKSEAELLLKIDNILAHYPDYPTAVSPKYGKVLIAVPEEHDQVVYNVPVNLAAVFPGEDIGIANKNGLLEMARNTYLNQKNEGGNDLVFCNLQAARLGILDLERFKRQVNYCLLPNGTASDRILQVHGRYSDHTDYGYMDRMGIWFENFALPAVINECLMQSYDGTIRVFPNWDKTKNASFNNLRAAGAFTVSAALENEQVRNITIVSEQGADLHLILPWEKCRCKRGELTANIIRSEITLKTMIGDTITFIP